MVAPELLHKVVAVGDRLARITEVEAYTADDPASHSFRGPTRRSASMFLPGGHWYVYLIYGVHLCVNLVTGGAGDGQAVLLRAGLLDGVTPAASRGPGRLARALGVERSLDGTRAMVFDDGLAPPRWPLVTPRVGIRVAVDVPWRWVSTEASEPPELPARWPPGR